MILSFSEFIAESNQKTTIDLNQFPNPLPKAFREIFLKKGLMDGELKDDIIEVDWVKIPAKQLKPSQKEIFLIDSLDMAAKGIVGGELGCLISKDNYILDGHHTWCATMFNNPNAKIEAFKVDLLIDDLIPVLRSYGDALNNKRRDKPKYNHINVFTATLEDVLNILNGININDDERFDKRKAKLWLHKKGKSYINSALNLIKTYQPPFDSLSRIDMPAIRKSTRDDIKVANSLKKGEIDINPPYANF